MATPSAPSSAPRRPRVPHRQQVARLQSEAEQLSLALLAARRHADARLSAPRPEPSPSGLWAAVAGRQQRRRRRAEQQNAQLRRLAQAQARHLRALRDLLAQRPLRADVDEQVRRLEGAVSRAPVAAAEREATFRFLVGHVNREHTRVDALWAAAEMQRLPPPGKRWLSSRESAVRFKQFGAIARAAVPFPIGAVQDACWHRLTHPKLRNPAAEYFAMVEQQGDTLQLVLSTVDDELKLKHTYCTASRRFVQTDRIIIATTVISEPRGSIDMASLGIKVHSTVLRVFRECEARTSGETSTMIEVFWSARGLSLNGVTQCSEQEFERYVDAGRTIMYNLMASEIESLEDFLLARCTARY